MKINYTQVAVAILFSMSIISCSKNGNDAGKVTVQFVNASPSSSVNFYADGNMVYENIGYPSQSSSTSLMSAGQHSLSVTAWRSTTTISFGSFTLDRDNFYTVFLIDSFTKPKIVPIKSDPNAATLDNYGKLRVLNFSPDSPPVDIKVTNLGLITVSDFILRNRTFNDQGSDTEKLSFKDMIAGPYSISVYAAGTNTLLYSRNVTLIKAKNYTIYLSGSISANTLMLGAVTHN